MERKQKNDCANQNMKESRRFQNTPASKIIFLFMETPCMDLRAGPTRKVIRRTCPVCNRQSTHAPLRRDGRGQNTCVCIPHAHVYRSVLSREQTRLALSKLKKNFVFVEIRLACIHTYPHCCCCAACIRFGAPCSCQRSFCFLYCDARYTCISGFGVVR